LCCGRGGWLGLDRATIRLRRARRRLRGAVGCGGASSIRAVAVAWPDPPRSSDGPVAVGDFGRRGCGEDPARQPRARDDVYLGAASRARTAAAAQRFGLSRGGLAAMRLAVVDSPGPPPHAAAAVEGWAQVLATRSLPAGSVERAMIGSLVRFDAGGVAGRRA
jgi:hypothetical protein